LAGRPWSLIFGKGRPLALASPAFVTGLCHQRLPCRVRRRACRDGLRYADGWWPIARARWLAPVLEAAAPSPWPICTHRSQRAG